MISTCYAVLNNLLSNFKPQAQIMIKTFIYSIAKLMANFGGSEVKTLKSPT